MITIASAFWRNDQPDGIGVMVNRDDFQDLDNAIAIALEMYARKKGHDFDFYFTLLRGFALNKREIGPAESLSIIGMIYTLEQHGMISADEFNGCLFLHDLETDEVEEVFIEWEDELVPKKDDPDIVRTGEDPELQDGGGDNGDGQLNE